SAVGRTFGNFVFAATTSARNITLQGNNTHTVGNFTLGAYTNFTRPAGTANLTFGNFSAANNSIIQFNHNGTLTFSGTTTLNTAAGISTLTFGSNVTNITHTGAVTYGGAAGCNVQYNNTGTVTFNSTTTLNNATSPANMLTFANTVTNVFHRNNVSYGNRADVTYNNNGVVHVRTTAATSNVNLSSGTGCIITFNNNGDFEVSGSVDFNSNLTNPTNVTYNNTGKVDFGDSDIAPAETFRVRDGGKLIINNTAQNVRFWGSITNGHLNVTYNFQQNGSLQIDGSVSIGSNASFTTNNNVTSVSIGSTSSTISFDTNATFTMANNGNVAINGSLTMNGGGSNYQYNNAGTVTFGSTVTATNISGTLNVQFNNSGNTTYNGNVTLSTALGATNSITYLFAGGKTANINADFTVTGACNNLITIGRTGTGSATLNLTATPPNRNWIRVHVSNINASSLPNNIRAYAYTDGGGNTGIDFRNNSTSTNRTLYWVAGGTHSGTNTLWSNVNNWSYEPDIYVNAGCIPTAQDSVVFGHHDISFSPTRSTVDVDGNYAVGGMRWSATDVTPSMPILQSVGGVTRTLTIGGAFDCYRAAGAVAFQNESATQRLNFVFTGSVRTPANGWNDIRSGGVNFPREVIFNGASDNTRWRLIDNFSARIDAGANPVNNGSVYLQRGTFDTNGKNLLIGRFNAFEYGTSTFTAPRELIISGNSHWTFQGRSGNLTPGSVTNIHVLDLQGTNLTFNTPSSGSYWYFSGANVDSTANTEGSHVYLALSRWTNAMREVPSMGFGFRVLDIDIGTDNNQNFPFIFRELKLVPNTIGNQDRQIYIQPWGYPPGTQHIFKGIVDFGNNTRANPNNVVGTVINGVHVNPNATWSNVNRFEKDVFIGTNCQIPFWGSYRFDGKVTVGGSSVVWFRANTGITAYQFNDDVTLGSAVIANFQARVVWPNQTKKLIIGQESIAYVGDIPSTTLPPTEYQIGGQYNQWGDIHLLSQGRLVLNNGKGPGGNTITNTIRNLQLGEFSVVEFNTEMVGSGSNPQTQITGYMTTTFVSNCSVWATIRSLLEGKQADVRFTNAHTGTNAVGRLIVKDILVSTAPPNLEINQGTDAGNNTGVTFNGGSLSALNFYWVGGTNKNKLLNPHRKAADTNFDGTPDDNGDNVMWSNPANWYTEPATNPVRNNGELTEAMIMQNNQCVPTIVDNVYFLDDSFQGGIQHTDFTKHRRRVIVDIPQGQARNFMWFLTTPANMNLPGKVTTAGSFVTGTPAQGPAIFTNEQQPILATTEFQVAGNLRWAPTGGPMSMDFVTNPNSTAFETILRNDFVSRFSFVGQGNAGAPTTHTIESNGQRFAAEVYFDNRYSTWYPIDSLDVNSHRHGTRYPQILPASVAENVPTPWTRASVTIHQGALNMGSNSYKTGQPRRISLEGDWTISQLFGFAHFDASTSEVVFDGSVNSDNADDINIITSENFTIPAPSQPVAQPTGDPNGNYDPTRRRFYDLRIFKQTNTRDVRVLNSPVSVLRNIRIQRGRMWDNDEASSVPMQIKGKISGTGTFQMDAGTTLRLGSSQATGATDNRYTSAGVPIYNWGTEFPAAVNGYPTTFPLGYAKADITLHPTSTVFYWVNGHQNVSIVPDYGNITFIGHTAPTDFGTNWGNLRKRHLIRENVTGNVNYGGGNHAPASASLPVPTPTHGGTLVVQGNWTQNDGIDFLDNGNQINLTGSNPTFSVGAWAILTLGSGWDNSSLDALNRTLPLVNHATTFPTGTPTVVLNANSIVNYNAGANQAVRGLSGAGDASYGHLLIANRDRSTSAPLPILAQKTLDAPATIRGQLRIYPNAHLLDNGNQITMTSAGRLHMYRVLPAVNTTPVPANLDGHLDLYDLRTLSTNSGVTVSGSNHNTMVNSESRLSLGNATTATTFPTNVPNSNVFLQGRTTIVYNAGVAQNIRTFTDATDTTRIYSNLVLVNPAAGATAPVNKTAVQELGSGATVQAANAAGDATTYFQLKGDLIIGPNNSFVDNGYQVRNPNNISGDGNFRMPVLKTTADGITPLSGRTTLIGGGNPTGANGISRIMLGTATIATSFPVNFGGNNDSEISFEISPDNNLYGNVVYNSGRRQSIRALNNTAINGERTYANLTLTNPSSTPNGPVPKSSAGSFRVRGTV
ncbi:MAG: hypothetical protein NZM39_12260, partial [Bernardetiaceae bacterium]|nr:hypothetical protein [Bernardetiaceae bacterium]